ncbi:MAG: protein TolR [Panacagrimonas sp.]
MAAPMTGSMRKRRMNADINVVPYIDVMLVLLIIFMVTAPLMTQGVEVDLPETDANPIQNPDEPVTLQVNRDGELFINRGENQGDAKPEEEIMRIAGSIIRNKPKEMFLVEADALVDYQYVATAMTLLQDAGVKKIGFVTDPISAPGKNDK